MKWNWLTGLILITFKAVYNVFCDSFGSGSSVISKDVKVILANPKDRVVYLRAMHDLKFNKINEVEITLSNKRKMKLTLSSSFLNPPTSISS